MAAQGERNNLWVITAQGELAYYDQTGTAKAEPDLTRALRPLIDAALRPDTPVRSYVGVVGDTATPQPWGQVSLVLTDWMVRELYPTGGAPQAALTAFQQKNRVKSVYRGFELLLENRKPEYPQEPSFCPVLREGAPENTALGDVVDFMADTAVTWVVDLLASVPFGRRQQSAIIDLHARLHEGIVRKDRRRELGFAFADAGTGWEKTTTRSDYAVDQRTERSLTLDDAQLNALHTTQAFPRVERWLEIPHRQALPVRLRGFTHFANVDETALALLARHALIYTAPAGVRLLDRGMADAWNLYLLEGDVALLPEHGPTLTVSGGSAKAASPVAFLKPRKYTVNTLTRASFLWIHDALLAQLKVG